MTGKYFNFTDVLSYGWRVMKANLWFFVGLGFIWLIITYTPAAIEFIAARMDLPAPVFLAVRIITNIAGWIISTILGIGLIKIALSFCDERKPPLSMLFDAWGCFWRYVAAAILYGLIVLGGFILFIIPGIIWAIKFGLCLYFVVDKGLGPIEALKASSRTTMGIKWQLLGFGIICGLINLLGVLCLIVGIFATYPTVMVAQALVYRQLLAQTPELTEFDIGVPTASASEPLPNEQK